MCSAAMVIGFELRMVIEFFFFLRFYNDLWGMKMGFF